ncbi:hypothetical protein KPH14_005465 [Odynerus spinipes]|uniref:Uncharacterized protein n=1 Tax=Odynerus spinipes TaxID=1348599 RepID=A0AAD9RBS7_9HYME|nr:hypothetical protein KPH14_005465 [Odynerus spinipes]
MQSPRVNGTLSEVVTESRVSSENSEGSVVEDELTALRRQVKDLSETIADLRRTIYTKDIQLENMRKDGERLSAELKKQQRCSRSLKQQLDDERYFYQREKDHFCEELQRQRNRSTGSGASKLQQQRLKEFEEAKDALDEENKQLREELAEKSETTYNLCIKFLRMKHAKDTFRRKLDQLHREHLRVMEETMEKLDEAREELNVIVSEKFQEPLPINKAKFLQVVQRNTRLVYENATLRVQIQHLTQSLNKLKNFAEKPKAIKVDARIIAKLATQSRKRRDSEIFRKNLPTSRVTQNENVSSSTSSSTSDSQLLDNSQNGKLKSKLRARTRDKLKFLAVKECPESDSMESKTELTEDKQGIDSNSLYPKDCVSAFSTDSIGHLQKSIEVRDTSTNT